MSCLKIINKDYVYILLISTKSYINLFNKRIIRYEVYCDLCSLTNMINTGE
jgi:hypothetical protein